ncbi:MAG: hypothetical protein AB4058_07590 [Microcystaceae cyanobacterium]
MHLAWQALFTCRVKQTIIIPILSILPSGLIRLIWVYWVGWALPIKSSHYALHKTYWQDY